MWMQLLHLYSAFELWRSWVISFFFFGGGEEGRGKAVMTSFILSFFFSRSIVSNKNVEIGMRHRKVVLSTSLRRVSWSRCNLYPMTSETVFLNACNETNEDFGVTSTFKYSENFKLTQSVFPCLDLLRFSIGIGLGVG